MSFKINLGMRVPDYKNGGETENLLLRLFKYNLLISGSTQSDRSAVLSHILNQFYEVAPELGVLLIKLKPNEGNYLYQLDKVYQYGDSELNIPYFIGKGFNEVSRENFAQYINAIFGFHFEMQVVIALLTRKYKSGRIPSSVVDFLSDLKDYLIKNPYSEEFTESNVMSVEKAIEIFQKNPILERTLWKPFRLPEWLKLWFEGKTVCIDLSQCDLYQQRVLVCLLLQAFKHLMPQREFNTPSGIIVIEGADDIFKKPPHEKYSRRFNQL
ncbi:MAG: hypothetical protein ACXACB_15765 [Promethearchaeota archaeon]|jgi:hypothetical protein